jgi:hypothetical protein
MFLRFPFLVIRLLAPQMIMDSTCSAHICQMTSAFLREVQLIFAGNLVASLGWELEAVNLVQYIALICAGLFSISILEIRLSAKWQSSQSGRMSHACFKQAADFVLHYY